jgi:drug/metabolite transporter (DMT)-like permease
MIKLILLGILSGAFFSTTFVFNDVMSVSGGHWLWSAILRYFFVIVFLIIILLLQGGIKRLKDVCKLFMENYWFWTISGTIGYGFFYALLCFSADYSPGWVIAATWQFTMFSGLFVFMMFGKKFPKKIWIFSFIIFVGVCLVNLSHMENFDLNALLLGGLPVLIASFFYPMGNQLVWEAKNGDHKNVPKITSKLLSNAFNKVFLMSIGSIPFWIILLIIINPPAPSDSQIITTALIAFFSGILATPIFLYARNLAKDSNEIAAVDSTQASEVGFSLIGGMIFLGNATLNLYSILGIALIIGGLLLFTKYQNA